MFFHLYMNYCSLIHQLLSICTFQMIKLKGKPRQIHGLPTWQIHPKQTNPALPAQTSHSPLPTWLTKFWFVIKSNITNLKNLSFRPSNFKFQIFITHPASSAEGTYQIIIINYLTLPISDDYFNVTCNVALLCVQLNISVISILISFLLMDVNGVKVQLDSAVLLPHPPTC